MTVNGPAKIRPLEQQQKKMGSSFLLTCNFHFAKLPVNMNPGCKHVKKYYFRFRATASVRSRELEYFLRNVIEPMGLVSGFSAVSFYKLRRGEVWQQFGQEFSIEDDRLQGAVLPNPEAIYSHDPVVGKVVLRPIAGLVLEFERRKGTTSLGFLKFRKTIRDVWGKVIGRFDYGDDWVFQGYLSPPNPRILELIRAFGCYLDVLDDADFLEH